MAIRQALASTGCSSCRSAVLRLFATGVAAPAPAQRGLANKTAQARVSKLEAYATRSYSTTPRRLATSPSNDKARHDEPSSASESSLDNGAQDDTAGQPRDNAIEDSVPWYLQVEPPRHVATIEPPPLPHVPSDAPSILSSILQYASEEMGLDDLALLDLRKLDPAPALGSNLFMLFGTARSERHLNVSAGRFVRWLRAKHRVHADADGLLGPNERKTKLRRKARKAKLLQIMGTDDTDDGIRTGWICVNLGTIGSRGPEQATLGEDGRLTGFGSVQQGTSIVFQIMTEGRRAEMNLEALWTSSLEASLEGRKDAYGHELSAPKVNNHNSNPADALRSLARPSSSNSGASNPFAKHAASFSTIRNVQSPVPGRHESEGPNKGLVLGELTKLPRNDVAEKLRVLGLLQNFLNHASVHELATATGGRPSERAQETQFTKLYDSTIEGLSPAQSWTCRLAFHARCVEFSPSLVAHAAISQKLLQEMQQHRILVKTEDCVRLLGAIFESQHPKAIASRSDLALELLNTLHQRGQDIIASDIIVSLLQIAYRNPNVQAHSALISNLWDLIAQARLPSLPEPALLRLLQVAARNPSDNEFTTLWNIWDVAPRYMQARSASMYLEFFRIVTETRHSGLCAKVVRRALLDMPAERPPVALHGQLTAALRQCVNVADPTAERLARDLPAGATDGTDGKDSGLANREFVRILAQLNALQHAGF